MQVRLVKKQVILNEGKNDEKKFYIFSLVLENGNVIRIQPNSYEDKTGKKHSNYNELVSSEGLVDTIRQAQNLMQIYYKLGYKFINNNIRVIRFICKTYHPDWLVDL